MTYADYRLSEIREPVIIALHDADRTRFPNLALMKLAAWHKSKGHNVDWFLPLAAEHYACVYSSKVFTYTPESTYLHGRIIRGGTGYEQRKNKVLPEAIEHICPDYSIYNLDYSVGFLTRGCPLKCSWCVVPKKEGDIRKNADIDEFLRHDRAVLLDNNILASRHGIQQLEKISGMGIRIDCNQGLDARRVDAQVAHLLSKIKWIRFIRFACDQRSQMKSIEKAVSLLRAAGSHAELFCYLLVKDDIEDAHDRAVFLRSLKIDPFAQPYRELSGNKPPSHEARRFARWVNHKAIFKTVSWADYDSSVRGRKVA